MLVLSRKKNEQIIIGDGVTITVLRIQGKTVKLGIRAGDDVKIVRGEPIQPHVDAGGVALSECDQMIADPTAGIAAGEVTVGAAFHPAGAEHQGNARHDCRPAWLTICCCS